MPRSQCRLIPVMLGVFCFMALFDIALSARGQAGQSVTTIPWEKGPTVGKLGDIAEIKVPEGYRFTGKEGVKQVLELTHNPASGHELGALIPHAPNGANWILFFTFEETGYVKDEEKDKLDNDAILKSLKEGTEQANEVRKTKGWKPYHLLDWSQPPFYDGTTHYLTWSVRGQEEGDQSENINYSVRVLGRRGTMDVDLVLGPELVPTVVPEFQGLMGGFSFVQGNKYSEWMPGDKVAEYGLTALIVGGAAAVALKSGLLAKFWKLIVVFFVAVLGALKRLFSYLKRMIKGEAAEERTAPQE
jgi:uncharacterized membrane-anchored protein